MHFVETIKIKDGTVMALPYHQTRMERTVRRFFPGLALHDMPRLCEIIDAKAGEGILKARVVYGEKGVETVEYAPYHMREMKTLQVVEGGDISYEYKSTDRSRLNMLAEKKGNSDEVIILKHGLLTDTSFTNIAIHDGNGWITPRRPLLYGTKRAALLDQGVLTEADITIGDLQRATRVSLFNAMIDFGEREIAVHDINTELI